MRKTLAGIGALSLTALSLAYCSSDNNTGGNLDMAMTGADLSSSTGADLSEPAVDQATAGDQATGDMATTVAPPSDFFVLRIGTGGTLTSASTAGFLERRKIADGTIVGNVMPLPIAANGTDKPLTFSGTATNEGLLTRSADGKYLAVAGYAAIPGVASISDTSAATYNRAVGLINAANVIDTKTGVNMYLSNARGVTTTNGTDIWFSSDAGVVFTKAYPNVAPVLLSSTNVRAIDLFKQNGVNQLYASSNASNEAGIYTVGTGTTMTGTATTTKLVGFTNTTSVSPYGFVAMDLDGNGALDLIYVADDSTAGKGGVQRWKLVNTTWTLDSTILLGATSGARAVAGYLTVAGAVKTVTLVATSAELSAAINPRVVQIVDANATSTGVKKDLVTAAVGTTYRGIALPPQ